MKLYGVFQDFLFILLEDFVILFLCELMNYSVRLIDKIQKVTTNKN